MEISERDAFLKICSFIKETLEWYEPDPSEREPDYTKRVLAPQLANFLRRTNSPFVLRADGKLRPQPVVFGGWSQYPDIAFNLGLERTVAVEVKFFSGPSDKSALLTAIGQALLYTAGGYETSLVILVARQTGITLADSDMAKISGLLASHGYGLFTLC